MKTSIYLLCQFEQLALNRFPTSSVQATSLSVSSSSSAAKSISLMPPASTSGSDIAGMGGMGNTAFAAASGTSIGTSSGDMSDMGGGSMGSTVTGSMFDVLRIQMECTELEDNLVTLQSVCLTAEARFNALLNRPFDVPVYVPDSLVQHFYRIDEHILTDSILTHNPMITMLEAEGEAFYAKAKVERHMSYPMVGVGLQYFLVSEAADPMGMPNMSGKGTTMPTLKISLPLFRRKYNAQQRESHNYRMASKLKCDNIQDQLQAEYINVRQQLDDVARKVLLYEQQYSSSFFTWQLIVHEFSTGCQSLTDIIQVERQMLDYKLKKNEVIAAYNIMVAAMEKLIVR